ncbi:hypothetical protein VOLCADRAFT_87649 [Volvox carteri f. nagariensis]|uniref:Uncharacterized protein n=1 Tax=Volvox carteri f. nagariensis TaxID=3068 RepID=D8TLW0_VOLCA|nr:uncharacterized protein VOLCADRAFT_87649 [Volvox carteri f. nagariensis]EFJ51532.1 hypothetical protein VOLCADRAFT_87649 [Volvox carteri f. nagariensis]|eukprot:XP_002947484.1 hypothetical protein VOLCADRAFT_87649 [Volvox carteri f. nagariensis]
MTRCERNFGGMLVKSTISGVCRAAYVRYTQQAVLPDLELHNVDAAALTAEPEEVKAPGTEEPNSPLASVDQGTQSSGMKRCRTSQQPAGVTAAAAAIDTTREPTTGSQGTKNPSSPARQRHRRQQRGPTSSAPPAEAAAGHADANPAAAVPAALPNPENRYGHAPSIFRPQLPAHLKMADPEARHDRAPAAIADLPQAVELNDATTSLAPASASAAKPQTEGPDPDNAKRQRRAGAASAPAPPLQSATLSAGSRSPKAIYQPPLDDSAAAAAAGVGQAHAALPPPSVPQEPQATSSAAQDLPVVPPAAAAAAAAARNALATKAAVAPSVTAASNADGASFGDATTAIADCATAPETAVPDPDAAAVQQAVPDAGPSGKAPAGRPSARTTAAGASVSGVDPAARGRVSSSIGGGSGGRKRSGVDGDDGVDGAGGRPYRRRCLGDGITADGRQGSGGVQAVDLRTAVQSLGTDGRGGIATVPLPGLGSPPPPRSHVEPPRAATQTATASTTAGVPVSGSREGEGWRVQQHQQHQHQLLRQRPDDSDAFEDEPQLQQPQQLLRRAHQSLLSELRRPPSSRLLLDSTDAVTDLCTAVELVLEHLAVNAQAPCRISRSCDDLGLRSSAVVAITGDWRGHVSLLAALLATLGGAISVLLSGSGSSGETSLEDGSRGFPVPPPPPPGQRSDTHLALLMTAAAQETAAVALAALHASCRQIGSACTRAIAATAAVATAAGRTGEEGASLRPAAAAAFASIADQLHAGGRAAATALGMARAAAAGAAAAACSTTDPKVPLSVAAAAAGGLLEGCVMTVRLQRLGQPQETLLRLLQPCTDVLDATLQEAAAAAAAAATVGAEAAAQSFGGSYSPSALNNAGHPRVAILDMTLGYCWSRLRAQPPLQGPLQPAASAAEHLVSPAPATAAVSGVPCWHPARGALGALMMGSLGFARVLQLAVSGESAECAAAVLEGQSQGSLFADTQLLAKTVIEVLRMPAPPPGGSAVALPNAATCMTLANALLSDAAAAARRLNLLYGGVADTPSGRAWLAALPPSATGCIRGVLDKAFVCEVSVLTAAYGMLSSASQVPPAKAVATPGGDAATADRAGSARAQVARGERARAAAAALGALADLQFCALQLRAHGDLVARLSTDALSSPAAALPPLLALLPCYPAFELAYGSGGRGNDGFAAVPVAASRLAFLLPLAASCMPHAEDLGGAAYVVLPYIFLLLKGAPESVAQAAHATWAALVSSLCEKETAVTAEAAGIAGNVRRRPDGASSTVAEKSQGRSRAGPSILHGRRGLTTIGSGGDGGIQGVLAAEEEEEEEQRRSVAGVALAASMLPYYIDRTCQEPCSEGDLELLEWGVRQALQSLPEAHPMKAWCAARLVIQLREWATACDGVAEGPSLAKGPSGHERRLRVGTSGGDEKESPGAAAGCDAQVLTRRCAGIVAGVMMVIDFRLVPQALGRLRVELQTLPLGGGLILQQFHDVWLTCSDYGRKQLLEEWFRHVLAKMHVRAKL